MTRDSGWPAFWQRRGTKAALLLPLAACLWLLGRLRRLLYALHLKRRWRAPVPVVVVGNVTVGGTGKTPLLLLLAQRLQEAGLRPGIVSRGWGRRGRAVLEVTPDANPRDCGDEPLLLRQRSGCPVWVGADRAAAGQALLAAHPEVDLLLSDDGLQHPGLARDLELVLVDTRGPGNGWLLPAGPLRESWWRQRDATLGPVEALDHLPGVCFALTRHAAALRHLGSGRRLSTQDFLREHAGSNVSAAAGIGHPGQFFQMLRDDGFVLTATLALPDHCNMRGDPFAPLRTSVASAASAPGDEASSLAARTAPTAADCVLITDKDALKCTPQTPGFETLWAVELRLHADPALLHWLLLHLPILQSRIHGSTPA